MYAVCMLCEMERVMQIRVGMEAGRIRFEFRSITVRSDRGLPESFR